MFVYNLCTGAYLGSDILLVSHSTPEDREDVEREVAIMHHLSGHVNIVKLIAAFEDKQNVQLVCVCLLF